MDKIFNIVIKFTGVLYLVLALLYKLGMFQPSTFSIEINMIIIGVFFLFTKYEKIKLKGENNE